MRSPFCPYATHRRGQDVQAPKAPLEKTGGDLDYLLGRFKQTWD